MFTYKVTDIHGKISNYTANEHSFDDGLINLNHATAVTFFVIKNWVEVTIEKLNELGEVLEHQEYTNAKMHLHQESNYDRLYA